MESMKATTELWCAAWFTVKWNILFQIIHHVAADAFVDAVKTAWCWHKTLSLHNYILMFCCVPVQLFQSNPKYWLVFVLFSGSLISVGFKEPYLSIVGRALRKVKHAYTQVTHIKISRIKPVQAVVNVLIFILHVKRINIKPIQLISNTFLNFCQSLYVNGELQPWLIFF